MSAHSSTALPAPVSSLNPGQTNPPPRPELPSDPVRPEAPDKQCYSCLLWQRMRRLMAPEQQQQQQQPAHKLPSAQPVTAVAADSSGADTPDASVPAQLPQEYVKLQHHVLQQQEQRQQQQQPPQTGTIQNPAAADCLGCRLTGLALGVGGSVYVGSRLLQEPYPKGMHKYSLIGVSAGLFALGVGRALGF